MSISYSEKIPNNVNLSEDRTLQRALEQWQPNYLHWWKDMGPDGSQNFDVYLRTAYTLVGQPDHLSVHPGAVVITPGPLTALARYSVEREA